MASKPTNPTNPAAPVIAPLAMIRFALAMGVLMFGAVIVFVHRQPTWSPATSLPAALRYAQVAVAIASVGVAFVLRGRAAAEMDMAKRNSLVLTGWSVAEGAALLGGVIFFLTPEWQWYALGLVAMLATFRLLPARR
jgi:hypothetical protein